MLATNVCLQLNTCCNSCFQSNTHVLLFYCNRHELQAAVEQDSAKRMRRTNALVSMEEKEMTYTDLAANQNQKHKVWNAIMGHLTSLETHGSKKPPEQPWASYCECALVQFEDEIELPQAFASANVEFSEILQVVTVELAAAAANGKRIGTSLSQLVKKKNQACALQQDREQKQKQKLMDLVDETTAKELRDTAKILF